MTPTSVTCGKVVALRDHLRADEHVDLAGGEPPQQGGDRAAPADGVAIDAGDARLREQRRDLVLDPLGAEADVLEDTDPAQCAHADGIRTA